MREQFQGREKVQDEAQQLMFLHAIHPACLAAQQREQDTLEPHCCRAAVVEIIVPVDCPVSSPCLVSRQSNSSGHYPFQPALSLENEEGEPKLATLNIRHPSLHHLEQDGQAPEDVEEEGSAAGPRA
ncbi:uncharacterized protein LOC144262302 [Eretmochelys imbricata]